MVINYKVKTVYSNKNAYKLYRNFDDISNIIPKPYKLHGR